MTEQEYINDIKNKIIESLNIKYNPDVFEKEKLEQQAKETLATVFQNPELLDSIASQIKDWSYAQAKEWQYVQTPDMARGFLSLVGIRNLTNDMVKKFKEEQLVQNQQSPTR